MTFQKTWLTLICIGLGVGLGIGTFASDILQARTQFIESLPQSLHPCIARQASAGKLWAQVTQGNEAYYLVGIEEGPDDQYYETLIHVNPGGCAPLISKADAGGFPLSNYVDKAIARELAYQSEEKRMVLFGGKDKLQEYYDQQAFDNSVNTYITIDEVWALEQLGIKIPDSDNIIVVGPEGIPAEQRLQE